MRPYKVYSTSVGRFTRVVAARTKKAAMEALGLSASDARRYLSETGNQKDIDQAMAEPGVVFRRRGYGPNDEWERNSHII